MLKGYGVLATQTSTSIVFFMLITIECEHEN